MGIDFLPGIAIQYRSRPVLWYYQSRREHIVGASIRLLNVGT